MLAAYQTLAPENMQQCVILLDMSSQYTAVIKEDGDWWVGWIEEVPGVNCQEASRDELLESLKEALREALDFNRAEAIRAAGTGFSEEPIAV